MSSIIMKDIRKSYDCKPVLSGVSVSLSEGKRVALVGENGSGKTTLLRIMARKIEVDSGELISPKNACVYIAQDFSGDDQETPYDFLRRRVSKIHEAIRLLDETGFSLGKNDGRLYGVNCGNLSGGERKKLEIVAGLSSGANFVALDEPENHLDYQTIEWLIGTLLRFRGGLIFVSHDQYLIDQLADTILELAGGIVTAYSMKYEAYLAEKERQVAGRARRWGYEEKTIKRLRKTVEMMKLRAQQASDTARTYQQTKRRLKEMRERHGEKPTVDYNKPSVKLADAEQKKGKLIALVDHVNFAYETTQIFYDASVELRFGEKVVLFGPNGVGKSTLVRLLTGELIPQSGTSRIGVAIRTQFMTQDHLAGIDHTKPVLEVFETTLGWPEGRCRSYLAKYGIGSELVSQPVQIISGGQQARFKLALIFAQEPEFLILDEPTNHVDPPTWEAIVEAVKGYSGTVLAVTHDREFIDAITERLWVIRDRKVFVEQGNLSEYLERKRR